MRWLIPDSIFRFKGFSLFVLITGFLGITFQVQTFGVIAYYAKHFSTGKPMIFNKFGYNLHLDPRSSVPLLVAVGAAIFVSLLLSAIAIYLSRLGTLKLQRKYNEVCSRRVVERLTSGVLNASCVDNHLSGLDRKLSRLAINDSRMCGLVLRFILDLIVPIGTLLVSFSVLFYLDFGLTSLIIAGTIGYAYFQYRVSRRAAHHSIQFEQVGPTARRDFNAIIQYYKFAPERSLSPLDSVDELFAGGSMDKLLDAYVGRVGSIAESRLVSGVFMAVILSLILLVMGTGSIRSGTGWGGLLIYLVALRFAMANLQKVFGQITAVNRFYPQVSRYFLFMQHYNVIPEEKSSPPLEYTLHTDSDCVKGSDRSIVLTADAWLALVSPLELSRYTVGIMLSGLFGTAPSTLQSAFCSMRFASSKHSCPNCSVRQLIGLQDGDTLTDGYKSKLPERLIKKFIEQFPEGLDQTIDPELWERVDPELKLVSSILSFLSTNCHLLLVEEKGFRSLDLETQRFLRHSLHGKFVVIVFKGRISGVGGYGEQHVAIHDGNALIGLGSPQWFASIKNEVRDRLWLNEGKGSTQTDNDDDDFDDEI